MRLEWITVVCLIIGTVQFAAGREIYVSPTGSDGNTGAKNSPFKTMDRARQAVRETDKSRPGETVVYFRDGIYPLEETVIFDARDSGSDTHPVIYRAFPGETPVFSGGSRLSGWKKEGSVLYSARTGNLDFRQMYVDGKRTRRSRFPNESQYFKLIDWNPADQTILLPFGTVQDWREFTEAEIHIQMQWSIAVMPLESFSLVTNSVALRTQNPARDLAFKRKFPGVRPNQSFHFENAREFIDEPGEWSLNHKEGCCCYWPDDSVDMISSEIVVPRLETLIRIQGTYDKPVRNLQFEGLTFMYSNWTLPNEQGYLNLQAGQYTIEPTEQNIQYVERPPAAVYAACVEQVVFKRNVFKHLGATGLDIHYGSRNCEIAGNVFYDIAGNAISHARCSDPDVEIHVAYNPEEKRDLCVDDWIHSNYIQEIGSGYGGTVGILSGWPVAVRIDHNELKDIAYSGISLGWGWTPESSAMRDNKIRWNLVDYPMTLFTDGAGIYTLSEMPGSVIASNIVSHVKKSPWAEDKLSVKGYYLDESSGGITLDNNLSLACDSNVERLYFNHPGHISIMPKVKTKYVKAVVGLEPEYKDIKRLAVD